MGKRVGTQAAGPSRECPASSRNPLRVAPRSFGRKASACSSACENGFDNRPESRLAGIRAPASITHSRPDQRTVHDARSLHRCGASVGYSWPSAWPPRCRPCRRLRHRRSIRHARRSASGQRVIDGHQVGALGSNASSRWRGLPQFGRDLFGGAEQRLSPRSRTAGRAGLRARPGDNLIRLHSGYSDTSFAITLDREGKCSCPGRDHLPVGTPFSTREPDQGPARDRGA